MGSKDFIRKNMTESEYRSEQYLVRDYLAQKYPEWNIKLEYHINNLKLDGKPYRRCILDIAVINEHKAVRLNGGYHFSSHRQEVKDEYQKEALVQAGWEVIDLDHHKMPNLFKKKKNDGTLKLAYGELDEYFG